MVLISKILSVLSRMVSKLDRILLHSGKNNAKSSTPGGSMFYKLTLAVTVVGVTSTTVWYIYKYYTSYQKASSHKSSSTEVLFFPDSSVACRSQFTKRHGCLSRACRFSHDPQLSYARLMRALASARRQLDICVFCLTCQELVEIVRELCERGVAVRVVTDSEQCNATGSQVRALRAAGVQVRHDSTSYFMHHKFLIVDGTMLLTGSFNWTRQAITGNFENVLITTDTVVLERYRREFERLWLLFDPRTRR